MPVPSRQSARRALAGLGALALGGAGLLAAPGAGAAPRAAAGATSQEYVVLYADGVQAATAHAAIARAGGRLVRENTAIGYAVVRAADAAFADRVAASPALDGAARNRPVGAVPHAAARSRDAVERLTPERVEARVGSSTAVRPVASAAGLRAEPLANRQWDMRQIGAAPAGSYRISQGSRRVLVGVIDTGIDGTHPDVKANYDLARSRNFTTDIPLIDGPCEFPSCKDPVNWDDDGHGTHVASTIASPINGLGIAGVAPKVTLVSLRAGQDSGYFFLPATLDALTYAGDIGVDVVNMSYYTDPWLYNCLDNPADSPAEQREQRTVRVATQRAMNYAIAHGVTPIAASGNEATDLGNPTSDDTSPDFPPGTAHPRTIDNSCISVPTETGGVTVVNSTGPSTRKSYFSNYGTEQSDIAAPGGDAYDSPDNTADPRNEVLAAYPARLAKLNGDIDSSGKPTSDFVVRNCAGGRCGYYQYLQGTSMAAPHAVGVAALIVSRYGAADPAHPGGWTLAPSRTRSLLLRTASEHACPQPRLFHYVRIRDDGTVGRESAFCAGTPGDNGFYGRGIVNAFAAVR